MNKSTSSKGSRGSLRRWLWRGATVAVLAFVAAGIVISILPKPEEVEFDTVTRGPLEVAVEASGHTHLKDRYVVSSPLAGSLPKLSWQVGDLLKQGTIITELLPLPSPLRNQSATAEAQARLAAAQAAVKQAGTHRSQTDAALKFAQEQAETHKQLASKGSIPQRTLERTLLELKTAEETHASAEFGVRVAAHQVEVARAALGTLDGRASAESLPIPSPTNGVVLTVIADSPGVVAPGSPLIELADPNTMEVVVDVLTEEAVNIPPGATAQITEWGGTEPLAAHVRRVDPKAFVKLSALGVEERRVNVRLHLDVQSKLWGTLGDGYRVEARIRLWQEDDVLTVANSALYKQGSTWYVLVDRNGVARETPISIGRQAELRTQVLDGLEEGQSVVLHPGKRVTDGVEIVPL